jgi:hypothetical protein
VTSTTADLTATTTIALADPTKRPGPQSPNNRFSRQPRGPWIPLWALLAIIAMILLIGAAAVTYEPSRPRPTIELSLATDLTTEPSTA